MSDAASILQIVTLAVTGWVLKEVIGLKTKVARMDQKLEDLPCDDCKPRR